MITGTKLEGIITYANKRFLELTGYSEKELIGMPHSINRHPDMPSSLFENMWKTIKANRIWRGYLKNMTKDGRYYWVIVWVQPKFDELKNPIGFVASRKVPYRSKIEQIQREYLTLPKEQREKMPYPYGKELIFGSDYIASKHLDRHLHERLIYLRKDSAKSHTGKIFPDNTLL
ncbi:MAG: PAS domain-containing protein [Campylobacterales bacterium]|nr:PAS domain-containing protein [Campylobacterales bacterium]